VFFFVFSWLHLFETTFNAELAELAEETAKKLRPIFERLAHDDV